MIGYNSWRVFGSESLRLKKEKIKICLMMHAMLTDSIAYIIIKTAILPEQFAKFRKAINYQSFKLSKGK